MIGIGFAARYTRDLSDYILGGRSLGSFVTAMSAGASDMRWLVVAGPAGCRLCVRRFLKAGSPLV